MVSIYEKFGKKIETLRRKKALSQEELAIKAKIDLTTVSEIESGLRNPSLKTIHKLALGLNSPLKEIFDL